MQRNNGARLFFLLLFSCGGQSTPLCVSSPIPAPSRSDRCPTPVPQSRRAEKHQSQRRADGPMRRHWCAPHSVTVTVSAAAATDGQSSAADGSRRSLPVHSPPPSLSLPIAPIRHRPASSLAPALHCSHDAQGHALVSMSGMRRCAAAALRPEEAFGSPTACGCPTVSVAASAAADAHCAFRTVSVSVPSDCDRLIRSLRLTAPPPPRPSARCRRHRHEPPRFRRRLDPKRQQQSHDRRVRGRRGN